MKKIYLSVVIPAFKEEGNLKRGVLEEVSEYLKKQKYSYEVLVVDDGSPDNTAKEVSKHIKKLPHFTLLRESHRGKGGTVIAGILKANGENILFTDMDQATPIDQASKILPQLDAGYDVVIGSRSGRPGEPLSRQLMAYGFLLLRTVILRLPYKDTQCGFKAFKASAAKEIVSKMKIFTLDAPQTGVTAAFDLELLYIARKMGYKTSEVPVSWRHVGSVRVNPLKDSYLGLKGMIQVRLNALMGKYK